MTAIGLVAGSEKLRRDIMSELRVTELDILGWQSLLDRNPEIFFGMEPGSKVGLLTKDDFEPPTAMMLVWESTPEGMRAYYCAFPGFESVDIDLLFIGDDSIIRRIHDANTPAPFADMKTQVRRRDMLLYIVKPRAQLLERGYEDFLDSLGLAFMGACR
jgi:uncharacterized membrane protein (UPF0127 family)